MIIIYTDGACSKNPGGFGGWGAYIQEGEEKLFLSGGDPCTTNNKMEMLAVIEALKYYKTEKNITLYSDSIYVIKGVTEWMDGWKKKSWKKVKNLDLWKEIDKLNNSTLFLGITSEAHSGIEGNEIADKLAVMEKNKLKQSAK
jgi:ribonuclease HI